MRPDEAKQGYERLLRGVRDEEVADSNPVTPDQWNACQMHICIDLHRDRLVGMPKQSHDHARMYI
jgi:hypothetical protein